MHNLLYRAAWRSQQGGLRYGAGQPGENKREKKPLKIIIAEFYVFSTFNMRGWGEDGGRE